MYFFMLNGSVSTLVILYSELINLTPKSEEEWPFLLHAQFTPRGHSLVMVYNYDIYYKTGPKSAQSYRITKTALPSIIYNGVPDWLYEGLFKDSLINNLPDVTTGNHTKRKQTLADHCINNFSSHCTRNRV